MSLLTSSPPEYVKIAGKEWRINTSFRVGIAFEQLMQEKSLSNPDKVARALSLYYPEIPVDISGAVDAMLWFYRCGVSAPQKQKGRQGIKRAYDFEQDAGLVYSAFLSQYQIDLSKCDMHWWRFRALFGGLSDCELVKVMQYRTADTKDMSKSQKKHFEKMRKLYAIKGSNIDEAISLAERDRRMKEYVDKRFAEAGGKN